MLFVRPRDREMEIWNGRRAGVEGAVATYGADAAYPIDQLDAEAARVRHRPRRRSSTGSASRLRPAIMRLVTELRRSDARLQTAPVRIEDPGPILHELRLRRSPAELARQRRACEISRDAHIEAMRYAQAGHVRVRGAGRARVRVPPNGSPRNGYPSIVASGPTPASSTTPRTPGAWRTAICC